MLGEFGPVLQAFAKLGIPASEVDEMELWQLAAMLGVDEQESANGASDSDILAARIAAAREGRPPPEPEPVLWLDPKSMKPGELRMRDY